MKENNFIGISLFLVGLIIIIIFNNLFVDVIVIILVTTYYILTTFFTRKKEKELLQENLNLKEKQTKIREKLMEETFTNSTLGNVSGFLVIFIDAFGYIKFKNNEYLGLLYDDHLIEKHVEKISCHPILLDFLNEAYLIEKDSSKELCIDDKYYLCNSQAIFQNEDSIGALITVKDITDVKRVEISQRNFIADASHELKTPVTGIKGTIELLINNPKMDDKNRNNFYRNIERDINNMQEIVLDLIEITKLDRLDFTISKEKVSIKTMVEEIIDNLDINKELSIKCLCEDTYINVDKKSFSIALKNLIKNAINYSDKGEIKIYNMQDNEWDYCIVEDQGIGIPENEIDKIFNRFYRVDKARSKNTGGSGLGLSIVKRIIEKHEGKIEVESKVNVGSKFIVKTKK